MGPKWRNDKGMSLVEVLVAVAIMGFLAFALTTQIIAQQRESKALAEKLGALDLQQFLLSILSNGSVCSFQLTDPSQAGFRSTNVINSESLPTQKIVLQRILMQPNSGSQVLVQVGEAASPISPHLTVSSIEIDSIEGSGDFFTAQFVVSLNSQGPRQLKPLRVRTTLQTDPASPANAKVVVGCMGGGASGRQWQSMSGVRSLNTNFTNETAQDIQVSVQIYSGPSGNRCSASIEVDGVRAAYNFVNDSSGAAMCNAVTTVPAGATYRAASSGAGYLYNWMELR